MEFTWQVRQASRICFWGMTENARMADFFPIPAT
jgi:hypothetical protein